MTKTEKKILESVCRDIENAEDKIDALERLFSEVKRMIYDHL